MESASRVEMRSSPKYLDWARYVCALLLYFYGVSKVTGHQLTVPSWVAQKPVGSLDGYTLTWYYFGYSHVYKDILGAIQITCASLLLFRKSSLLGAVMILPVMVNIILINIFYSITAGAERTAVFILACMLLILWHQREAFIEILWVHQSAESRPSRKFHWLLRALVLSFVLGQVVLGTVMAHRRGHFYSFDTSRSH